VEPVENDDMGSEDLMWMGEYYWYIYSILRLRMSL